MVDAGLARLQQEAELSRMNKIVGRSVKMTPSVPNPVKSAKSTKSTKPALRAVPPAVARPTTSKFKLASPSAFLSHNQIGSSSAPSVTQPIVSVPQFNTSNGVSAPLPASVLEPHGGLAASRWSPSPTVVDKSKLNSHNQAVTPSIGSRTLLSNSSAQIVVPLVGMSSSTSGQSIKSAISVIHKNGPESNHPVQSAAAVAPLTLITDGAVTNFTPVVIRTLVDEKHVKFAKDDDDAQLGIARLVKFDEKSLLTLELQVENDIVHSELLTESARFKIKRQNVTYRAGPTTRTPVWTIQFQLPSTAKAFVNYHNFSLSKLRRSGCSSRCSEQGQQTSIAPVSPTPSSAISSSSATTSRNDVTYLRNRISSSTFADLSQLEGQETLLSFNEEECNSMYDDEQEHSSFQDLLSLLEEDIVDGTIKVLNVKHGGSFIDHVSQIAKGVGLENDAEFMRHAKNVFIGGLTSSRYSDSKPILTVAEELVRAFLKSSKLVSQFPRIHLDTYVKTLSKKILYRAQNHQHATCTGIDDSAKSSDTVDTGQTVHESEVVETIKPDDITTHIELVNHVEAKKPAEAIKLVEPIRPVTVIQSVCAPINPFARKRRTYTRDELIKIRPDAILTNEMLTARRFVERYLPGQRGVSSADNTKITESGVRIVAGRNRGLQYKDSHRATATKLKPSEWKEQFANKATNQEVQEIEQQDEIIGDQVTEEFCLLPALLSIENTDHIAPKGIGCQGSIAEGHSAPFSKIFPADWELQFSGAPSNVAISSNIAETKEQRTTNENELEILSTEMNNSKAPVDTQHQNVYGESSDTSFTPAPAQTHAVLKDFVKTVEHEATIKVESEETTSSLLLSKNRGLSTSRYATPEVIDQAAVLRAMSDYTPRQAVKKEISSNKTSEFLAVSKSKQANSSWEAFLSPKQRGPSIKDEGVEAPKNDSENAAFTTEAEKSTAVTVPVKSVKEPSPAFENASNSERAPEILSPNQADDSAAVIGTTPWATANTSGIQAVQAVQEKAHLSTTFATDKIMESQRVVPKVKCHITTNSDVDRLAQALSYMEVNARNAQPAPKRTTSPTVEELLAKKRANGLATSKWASPQAAVFNYVSHTPQSSSVGYNQLGLNTQNHDASFSLENVHYDPAMQTQSPYRDVSQHGQQFYVPPGQNANGMFPPEVKQQYPFQYMKYQPSFALAIPSGVTVQALVPLAANSSRNGNHFTSPRFSSFPPRPAMLEKPFSDSDGEDGLNATAPVFTPFHQINGSNMDRSALSAVYHRGNEQQEAIQARLNKSLAERRI